MPSPPEHRPPAVAEAIDVEVSDTQSHLAVDPGRLARLAGDVLRGEGIDAASISIALVDDPTIHRINRDHLDHDWPTDVISFALSDPGDRRLVGELVISTEMARSTAAELAEDPSDELELYVVHGLLHLCGYDDTSDEAALRMGERQRAILEGRRASTPRGLVP
ncbi:Endoribonuclease YbeY [Aquisphaera giovannonii]|uniref:Endoribonuclease YbeY n=1 Tax=Aquisphaera giovannonii TaxID=406548 RepID=A0A5B9VYT0_9BACT|nr:rRNA maturation RNase YbeY [Aquisphaera giovannonii]QEH33458.1 Endoribonuclease YbeY [Aquisphaera giovannonii]